ncbi:GntR family transcriptional regulator [Brevibacillus sp. B_LB10_24]|uniref:GntR family transcriptional regulator n=1 Tax=Brevibacillus TaxID=55080 RepID=UPI000300C8FB|nr:GntR family transcriptional regulator [Brevibacillus massiliensis]
MLKKLAQPETLADRAYKEIKKAILQSQFLPGDLLPEESIASMLGISRTPLRKAVTRLAYEGLVELETGKIARVASFTSQDMENFLRLRELLEGFSAEQAVPFVTAEFIDALKQNAEAQKVAIESKDFYAYIELDAQFHVMIAEMTQNAKLKDFIEQINNHLHRYLILSGTLENSADKALLEHHEIVKALQDRDVSLAGAAMRKHIRNVEIRTKQGSGGSHP